MRKKRSTRFQRFKACFLMVATGISIASVAHGQAQRLGHTLPHGWIDEPQDLPRSISPQKYDITLEEVDVPLRDGTILTARMFLPVREAADLPGPCIVSTNGYVPATSTWGEPILQYVTGPELEDLARRGYAGAFVFLRGAPLPEREALYYRYAEDGYDIVEWMAAQPWCNGKVGMVGASLSGISQWLTAREAPPSLKAIVPKVACADCYWNLWYRGGTLPGPGREARRPPLTAYDEYRATIDHRNYDSWWRERDTDTSDHRAMAENGIAVLHVGGWDDYIHTGGARAVEDLIAAGGNGMLIIGPWDHDTASTTLDGLQPYDFQIFTILWFDRFLKGIDNGIDDRAALLYIEGAGKYRFEKEWPIPGTNLTRLHLRAPRSGSAESINDGLLTACAPKQDETPVSYRHDPLGPFNDAGGGSVRLSQDQRPDEKDGLTWTTAALTRSTEVTGWPALEFWAASTAADTDFVAELTNVAADGSSSQITRGWLNAPRFFSRSDPPPLEADRIYRFRLELSLMSYVFPEGHRIRISLSGSDQPGIPPNSNAATITVFQDAKHSSYLELPVIRASWKGLPEENSCNGIVKQGD